MLPHHLKQKLCTERPKYRQGKKLTAVKVYTVADESQYLLIQGVPSIGIANELNAKCSTFGNVVALTPIEDYPSEQFTTTYLLKYQNITSARYAKRRLDDLEFYGGILHVCYAPEYETVGETRYKLQERRKTVARKCLENEKGNDSANHANPRSSDHTQPSETAQRLPSTYQYVNNSNMLLPQPQQYRQPTHIPEFSPEASAAQVESVSIEGLQFVTSSNIDSIGLRCAERPNENRKRKHVAAEAAGWSSATFNTNSSNCTIIGPKMPPATYTRQNPVEQTIGVNHPSTVPQCPEATSATHYHPHRKNLTVVDQPDLNIKPKIIRPLTSKQTSASRFVPRQLNAQLKAAAASSHKRVLADSTRLGKVQQATLPSHIEDAIRVSNKQLVASDTTLEIRKKLQLDT